jgi:hypothetical protein
VADLVARDEFTWAIRQSQELSDYDQERGHNLQIDATHPKLSQISQVPSCRNLGDQPYKQFVVG